MRCLFIVLVSSVAVLVLSCRSVRATPEESFWKWFQSNEDALFNFERDREATFDRLAAEMHKLDPSLTFEFGPIEGGRREFVISADGIRDAFPEVEALYAAAPALPRWKFIKFRPRRSPHDINYGNVSVQASSVRVQMKKNGQVADLTVFIPEYTEENRKAYTTIAFLLLDGALGEYDVETRVGHIHVGASPHDTRQMYSLEALPRAFDALFVN